jgi:DNA polymerase-1
MVTPFIHTNHAIASVKDASELLKRISWTKECAVDTETDGLYWALGNKPFMATFAPDDENAYYTYNPELAQMVLKGMEDMGALFVFHNAVFDFHMLRVWGSGWKPANGYRKLNLLDTMHAFRIQYPGESAALKTASKRFCSDMDVDGPQAVVKAWIKENTVMEKVAGKTVRREPTWDKVPVNIMVPYASQDVILTIRSHHALQKERAAWVQPERCVGKMPGLPEVVGEEMRTILTVTEMERRGMPVDIRHVRRGLASARTNHEALVKEWEASEFGSVKPTSPVALKKLLYETLGEPVKHRTKPTKTAPAGSPSTAEAALLDLETEGGKKVSNLLLPMRSWKKYGERLTEIDGFTGADLRVHTSLRADAARTGRFSSTEPALQNLTRPNPSKEYTMARAAFAPPKGKELLLADFSQIELRLAAHYMRDEAMIHALNTGQDFHQLTASKMYGVPFDKVTKSQRAIAKILNFSILYGAGIVRVTETLRYGAAGTDPLTADECAAALEAFGVDDLPDDESEWFVMLGKELLKSYHEANPKVRPFMDAAAENSKKYGGIYTAFGLFIPIPKPSYSQEYGRWLTYYHKAGNAIIQGSAAGLMKATLNRAADLCERFCAEKGLTMWEDIALIMSIHDETIFEVPEGMGVELAKYMDAELSVWPQFNVDIKLEYALVEQGSNWALKKGFEWREAA